MKRSIIAVCALAAVGTFGLGDCATMGDSADVYSNTQTQHEQTVRMATVESVRRVTIDDASPAPLGAIGGGALGAVAGSAFGAGHGSLLTGIIGGIAGAVAGDGTGSDVSRGWRSP